MGFGKCIEAFISWANPISKQFSIRIQHSSNGMSIHPWSHGEDVQFIQFWNTLQEIYSSRSDFCMVPHRVTRQLKMMNILWIFNGEKYYLMVNKILHYIIHVVPLQNVNIFIVVFHLNVKWWVHFLAAFEITEEERTPLKCLVFLQAFSMHISTKLWLS